MNSADDPAELLHEFIRLGRCVGDVNRDEAVGPHEFVRHLANACQARLGDRNMPAVLAEPIPCLEPADRAPRVGQRRRNVLAHLAC